MHSIQENPLTIDSMAMQGASTTLSSMKGLTRQWRWRNECMLEACAAKPLVERLLAARGLADDAAIRRFREPSLSDLHPPDALPGASTAAARLVKALKARERIAIFGDYDVDGIVSTAILFHTLKTIEPEAEIVTYIPHRLDEGYGLNAEAIVQLAGDGIDVIVSVDCGVSAIEPARMAKERGVDLIITDHHNFRRVDGQIVLPDACAVVHPRLPGGEYPFGELCGAGVAFKLAWEIARQWCGSDRVSAQLRDTLRELLPLAALGTIADVVPLIDENRVLASFGLRQMKESRYIGLQALIEAAGYSDRVIDARAVAFVLAPRLNASGRLDHASQAVRLLTEADADEAAQIAARLDAINRERQATERAILDRARQLAEDRGMTADDTRIIVLADEAWHPGVVGIVCSRLVEQFGRPAILLQRADGLCRGSGRSIDGYSLSDALAACADELLTFGGHDMAAGLSLNADRLESWTESITHHANEHISIDRLLPTVRLDCTAGLVELSLDVVRNLEAFAPFGRANPRPTIRIERVTIAGQPRQIGAHGRHLSMSVQQTVDGNDKSMRNVWWNGGERAGDLHAGMTIDLAIKPKINSWNGRTTVEGEIQDVRLRSDT